MPVQPDTTATPQALSRPTQHVRTLWGLVLLAGLALPYLAYWWADSATTERLREAGAQRLEVYATSLENLLDKYDLVPRMLELDKDVVRLLEHPGDEDARNSVNEYLEGLNQKAESSNIYIVNLQGRTQAASNWRQRDSFIGDDVNFRPYIRNALRGRPGGFYGVGTPPAWSRATSTRTASTRMAACWAWRRSRSASRTNSAAGPRAATRWRWWIRTA
ncbi:cache domain-containing protein [Massilia eburnea]|uniref:cache domain-containing protein n=1 Tax=Massilia eburnea TaxID=1776165 RepID=UPI003D6AE530